MSIRFYADSADPALVEPLLAQGIAYGVTTNPTILARDGWTAEELPRLYHTMVDAGAREVAVQAWGTTADGMMATARRIAGLGEQVVIKIPATRIGFHVAGAMTREGRPVLLTAVSSLAQAIAAGAVGITYIAPYLGRLIDAGRDGDRLVPQMAQVLAPTTTRVLVASVRSPQAVETMVAGGVTFISAHPDVIAACLVDDASDDAAAAFERDWNGGHPGS